MKQDVSFYSEGKSIAAHLYLPERRDAATPLPGIVLCHGFAGIKEMLLPAYAEGFARAGYAALTFDYRGFGDSEGEPGRLVPGDQVVDIRNALTYLAGLPEVDAARLGLWGTSFGGANAITAAAQDKRVKAVVVQLTFGSGERVITGNMSKEEKAKLLSSLERSRHKAVTKNKMLMLTPDKILTDEQSREFYTGMVKQFPKLATRLPVLTILHTIEYIPEETAARLKRPLFILSAGKDGVNPPDESQLLFEKAAGPKELYCITAATHYEVYSGEYLEEALARELAWFERYL